MLAVISPAKSLDFTSSAPDDDYSQPQFLAYSQQLIDQLQHLTPAQIGSLMKISDKLAGLNAARFSQWQYPFNEPEAKAALYAFTGDVYTGLGAQELDHDARHWANDHLRILSGLYGVLRPLDLMMPYRLEMGTKLANAHGSNLYAFWGTMITEHLNAVLAEQGDEYLINLASNEYFKAVVPKALQGQIITPVFKDYKKGQYKIISFYAKKARGMMVRYMIDHQLTHPQQLQQFDVAGYVYCAEESTDNQWVFKRHLAQ